MGARKVTKQEFYYIKEKLDKDTRAGSNVQRVAKQVSRSAETVRMIDLHKSFTAYVYRRTKHNPFRDSHLNKIVADTDQMDVPAQAHEYLHRANIEAQRAQLKHKVDAQGRWLTLLWFVTIALLLLGL